MANQGSQREQGIQGGQGSGESGDTCRVNGQKIRDKAFS